MAAKFLCLTKFDHVYYFQLNPTVKGLNIKFFFIFSSLVTRLKILIGKLSRMFLHVWHKRKAEWLLRMLSGLIPASYLSFTVCGESHLFTLTSCVDTTRCGQVESKD